MDGLSAAASITAVIQITVSIASVLKDYYEAVKDARRDIHRLYQSVNSLYLTITAVEALKIDFDNSKVFSGMLMADTDGIQMVWAEIRRLESKLGTAPSENNRTAGWLRSLKWPFQKKDVEKSIAAIELGKTTLILQFGIENLSVAPFQFHSL
jgi:ankyrin repeat domain-containing protein 50